MEGNESQEQALTRGLKEVLNIVLETYTHICSLYYQTSELRLIHYYVVTFMTRRHYGA